MTDVELRYKTDGKGPPSQEHVPVSLPPPAKRLLREIATTIILVLGTSWNTILSAIGYSEDDIQSYGEPTSKVYKILLLDASKNNGDTEAWWKQFLQKLTNFGNAELTNKTQEVYNNLNDAQSSNSHERVYPSLHGSDSHISTPPHLSGFQHVSLQAMMEDQKSRIGVSSTQWEIQHPEVLVKSSEDSDRVEPDRPEISMEINVVAEALDRVSHNPATAEITKWLRDGVPRIIQLERELKSQKTLRNIFENQNHDLKGQMNVHVTEVQSLKDMITTLTTENQELKRAKQDTQLNEFDFVTQREAQDMKDEERMQILEKQHSAPEGDNLADKEELRKLKRETTSLKKQIDEIVKVNHSWDEHYRKMKSQYEKQTIDLRKEVDVLLAVRSENDQLKEELTRLQHAMTEDQKKNDTVLLQAKERIDRLEKEKAEKQKETEVLRSKFDKVQGYARSLTSQRKDAESEISRLNEALAHKITISSSYPQRATAEVQKRQTSPLPSPILPAERPHESIPSGMESLIAHSLERPQAKRVESMSEGELRDELEILRQQTDVYRSDFQHERQDRQRIMGELDETKKELKKFQRDLKAPRPQVMGTKQRQLLEDEQYAQQLQRAENALQRPANYPYKPMTQKPVQPRYQAQPMPQQYQGPPQQRYRDYYTVEDVQALQMPHKGLVPHGGAAGRDQGYYRAPPNYAANDMWIDGNGGRLEIDGEVETDGGLPRGPDEGIDNSQGGSENNTCPRCKRSFSHGDEFAVHKDRCVTD